MVVCAGGAEPVALLHYGDSYAVALMDADGFLLVLTIPGCAQAATVAPDGIITTP